MGRHPSDAAKMPSPKTKVPAQEEASRRDFLVLAAGAVAGVGGACAAWPYLDSLTPPPLAPKDEPVEVDLSTIPEGSSKTVVWRGKPVFIRHRTAAEIAEARAVALDELKDPEPDAARVGASTFKGEALPQWLVVMGVCTHLGCVPLGQKPTETRGAYDGWYCSCHGAQYDGAGRIRKGPASRNLVVPPYSFVSATRIRIG